MKLENLVHSLKLCGWLGVSVAVLSACTFGAQRGYHRSGDGVAYGVVTGGIFPVPPITSLTFMPGVDGGSFEKIDSDYAKDNSRVFYKGRVLRGADPTTFRLLTAEYGVDSKRVYWEDRLMDGVQPDRLQVFSWCASDGTAWWFAGKRDEGGICSDADATTFRAIDGDGIFGKDKSHVFYKSTLIQGADPGTFERVRGSNLFSKDAKGVYLGEKLIPGADPTSWRRLMEGGYSADASSVFWETKRLEGAVVKSFVPSQGNPNYYGWGHDGTSWWYYGQRRDDGPNE